MHVHVCDMHVHVCTCSLLQCSVHIYVRKHLFVLTYCAVIGASLSEPHIDEMNARNPYIIIIIMFIYVWYVRHARTAIDIVQRCAVYFKRPHENICVSIVWTIRAVYTPF